MLDCLSIVYGVEKLWKITVYDLFIRLKNDKESLGNEEWSGRPSI